jgi:flagellar biosynthesis protein FlhF
MKIKHYRAPDMRQALRQVREAQGPDAVIVSSRRISGGVEVVAAVDYDADAVGEVNEVAYSATVPTQSFPETPAPRSDMNEELRTLRHMLETQLATLAWNDLSRRSPMQTELLKQLTELGLAQDLATELVTQLPSRLELSEAYRLALALLARRIETTGERWLETGGVVAFVGATGVGKTTLMAKLAARWVLRHGQRDIAIISTDSVRIGAHDQIHTLGRLLGVPAYAAEGPEALPDLLDQLSDKRLVLIDTAGLSQRDPRLEAELRILIASSDRLETALVISAAAQAGAIEEAFERFAAVTQPANVVLTKLDEATSLGGTLSALIRSKLPLAYVSDGQRVPEDLSPARAHQLLARAVELSRKAGAAADEDLLRRRFGAVAHALA